MIKRGMAIAVWLIVGHAILGALYGLLLQIPESNVFMLVASLLVVIVMLVWAGAVQATAVLGWVPGTSAAAALVRGARRAGWFVLPLAVFILVWLLTGFARNWMGAHRSEFDAWFIARLGWTDARSLHTTVAWVLWFVRYGIGVSLAVAFFAALLLGRRAGASPFAWIGRGFSWRALGVTAVVLWAGVWLPWQAADWRPVTLPVSWVQPAFAVAKLFVLFAVMNVAWALVLWWGAKQATTAPAVAPAGPTPVAASEPGPAQPDPPATMT